MARHLRRRQPGGGHRAAHITQQLAETIIGGQLCIAYVGLVNYAQQKTIIVDELQRTKCFLATGIYVSEKEARGGLKK